MNVEQGHLSERGHFGLLTVFDLVRLGAGLLCWVIELAIGGVALHWKLTHSFGVILMWFIGLPAVMLLALIGALIMPKQSREKCIFIFAPPLLVSGLLVLIAPIGFYDT